MSLSADTQRILKIALASETARDDVVTELGTQTTATEAAATDATAALALLAAGAAVTPAESVDATDLPSALTLVNEIKAQFNALLTAITAA